MELNEMIERLRRLRKDRDEWQQMGNRQRLCVKLDDIRITIDDRPNAGCMWQVDEPTNQYVVQPWFRAATVNMAMEASVDFVLAYLNAQVPQHLED